MMNKRKYMVFVYAVAVVSTIRNLVREVKNKQAKGKRQ